MPDLSLLECRKRKSGSHDIRKNGNYERKNRANKRANTMLKCLSKVLKDHGRPLYAIFLKLFAYFCFT